MLGFLYAATNGYNLTDYKDLNALGKDINTVTTNSDPIQSDSGFQYMHVFNKTSFDNEKDILPFLKALYSTSNPSNPDIDLPQAALERLDVDFGGFFYYLTQFLSKYQTVLISDLSKKGDLIITPGIEKVVEQTGADGANAFVMANNAYATAWAAAKQAVLDVADNGITTYTDSSAINMVRNSSIIIKYALKEAKDLVEAKNKRNALIISGFIDLAWEAIPGSKVVTVLLEGIKDACKTAVSEAFENNTDNIVVYGQQLANAFNKLPEKVGDKVLKDKKLSVDQKKVVFDILDQMTGDFKTTIY